MTKTQIAEAFSNGRFELIYSFLADDVEWNIVEEKRLSGKRSVIENCEQTAGYFKSVTTNFEIHNLIADDKKIVVSGTAEFLRDNERVSFVSACDIYEFNGENKLEKITSYCIKRKPEFKEMRANTVGFFEIQSSEPEREIDFYRTLFGWQFVKQDVPNLEYYAIETKSIRGGILKRPAQIPPLESGTNAFVCSIQVENFDQTDEKIIALGGRTALPKFAVPGKCWQGYFIDRDNNTFGIFEVDPNAR